MNRIKSLIGWMDNKYRLVVFLSIFFPLLSALSIYLMFVGGSIGLNIMLLIALIPLSLLSWIALVATTKFRKAIAGFIFIFNKAYFLKQSYDKLEKWGILDIKDGKLIFKK